MAHVKKFGLQTKNESEATLILNENISENEINPPIETNDKNLSLQKFTERKNNRT